MRAFEIFMLHCDYSLCFFFSFTQSKIGSRHHIFYSFVQNSNSQHTNCEKSCIKINEEATKQASIFDFTEKFLFSNFTIWKTRHTSLIASISEKICDTTFTEFHVVLVFQIVLISRKRQLSLHAFSFPSKSDFFPLFVKKALKRPLPHG